MIVYPSTYQMNAVELMEYVFDQNETYFEEDQYQEWLERFPDDWRLAAVTAIEQVFDKRVSRPNRIASDGDQVSWSDQRMAMLAAKLTDLKADIDADGLFGTMSVTKAFLTGCTTEGDV